MITILNRTLIRMRDGVFTAAHVCRAPTQLCILGGSRMLREYDLRLFCIAVQYLRLASGLIKPVVDVYANI
jgi:hypothetical protein